MLVDCEPYGAYSSQLYFDAISFGVDGGYCITAPRTERVTARYINFFRYKDPSTAFIAGGASVNWQTSFAKEGVKINALDSPALKALAEALKAPDVAGLVVRWNAYRTIYYDDPTLSNSDNGPADAAAAALLAKLQAGGWQPNPARSRRVGAIGLWRPDEPVHEPGGRALLSIIPPSGRPKVGSAQAAIAGNRLTVDLSNSIGETGPDLAKQDLGTLHFVAASADGKTVMELGSLAPAAYGRAAYEASSGIVTIDIADSAAAAFAAGNDIQMRNDDGSGKYGKTVYLGEQARRAIPAAPNLYINEGDDIKTAVRVYDRGVPAGAGIVVTMVGAPSASIVTNATTGADGIAQLEYQGPQFGAVEGFVLLTGPNPPLPASINPLTTTYMYIRSLSLDADTGALEPSWDNVHRAVLSKWQAMAPCMDNWLDLGNEAQVRAYGPLIRQLTDPGNFEWFRFMPVTRDMTQGERTLLYAFLGEAPPTAKARAFAAAEALEEPVVDLNRLSRAMRGGS
jgi:hypothetical protein